MQIIGRIEVQYVSDILALGDLLRYARKNKLGKNNGDIMGLIFISVRHHDLNALVQSRKYTIHAAAKTNINKKYPFLTTT